MPRRPARAANVGRNLLGDERRDERWHSMRDELWRLLDGLLAPAGSPSSAPATPTTCR